MKASPETMKVLNDNPPAVMKNGTIVALNTWLEQVGVTPVTAWRWRRKGWLRIVNIQGRVYLTPEAIAEFQRRAEAGEFAKEHKAPRKGGA